MEVKKPTAKSKVEAVLFSVGRKISVDELAKLCRSKSEDVLLALQELKTDYEQKQSSLMVVDEGDFWKFTVMDHFIPMVRKIVTETDLPKTVIETLAVIAFKYPILQSDLIKLRTNKAYDHLVELESSGYISRQKKGRTNLIKLTEKFFKYFDLTEESLKEKFKDFESISQAIKSKEEEVDKIKLEQKKRAEDLGKEDEKIKKEIESLDEAGEDYAIPLKTYETTEEAHDKKEDSKIEGNPKEKKIDEKKEKHKDSEVIDVNEVKTEELKHESSQENNEQKEKLVMQVHEEKKHKKKSHGVKLTPDMEKKVDEQVDTMLHGVKEENKADFQAESKEKQNNGENNQI